MANERREFLKIFGSLTAAAAAGAGCDSALAAGQPESAGTVSGATATSPRAFRDGRIALELEGTFAGWLDTFAGGAAVGRVVAQRGSRKKQLAGVRYEDVTFQCGPGMSDAFYQWIQEALAGHPRRSGAIVLLDFNFAQRARMDFTEALISELTMPALDGSSKDEVQMTLKVSPGTVVYKKGDGSRPQYPPVGNSRVPKWLGSNFRLQIDGLDTATPHVVTVDALTFRRRRADDGDGDHDRDDRHGRGGALDVPDLVFSVAAADADPVLAWEQDFLIAGNDGDDRERSGTLHYLTPDLSKDIFTLTFGHLGVFRLSPSPVDSSTETIETLEVGLYCEQIDFTHTA